VTEDVTDIILNLKGLVVRSDLEEPTTIYLKAKGAAEVTAGDIAPPAGIEILNPELHIATLARGASLEMEMTVERGVGYRMADKNKKPRDPIGVIPVDSIFSPVRKVSYAVENTRVEQMTDRDRLILDVETDGSITAREAVASAGGTLQGAGGPGRPRRPPRSRRRGPGCRARRAPSRHVPGRARVGSRPGRRPRPRPHRRVPQDVCSGCARQPAGLPLRTGALPRRLRP